ncbi:hypothetical protein RvY_11738 [Ramazzottius varieornatus]|uniref:Uncharacterized protein n=1 Tax=Ramazzottius varieornatus TaxID=947166 RepID=A0A1D1VQY2_RAMVA|nr:hypothetical protein RvY_11738 [Ramazzottius varieornatus]
MRLRDEVPEEEPPVIPFRIPRPKLLPSLIILRNFILEGRTIWTASWWLEEYLPLWYSQVVTGEVESVGDNEPRMTEWLDQDLDVSQAAPPVSIPPPDYPHHAIQTDVAADQDVDR